MFPQQLSHVLKVLENNPWNVVHGQELRLQMVTMVNVAFLGGIG